MLGSGITVILSGMAYFWNIHNYAYFIGTQAISGLFEATGWPIVVAIVAHWFGKGRRGLVMGIWNSHTSVGNVVGALMSAAVVGYGWGYSYLLLGGFIPVIGMIVWFFVVTEPAHVGYKRPDERISTEVVQGTEEEEGTVIGMAKQPQTGINFLSAWLIPGVAPFAFALFFAKFVAYTFLYWLPGKLHQD